MIKISAKCAATRALLLSLATLSGCATYDLESSVGDFFEPGVASTPDVINLGSTGVYVTTAQTPKRAGVMTRTGENSDGYRTLQNQTAIYGRLYRRLEVAPEGDWTPDSTDDGPKIISCKKGSKGLGGFLGALLGYKNATTAALTVTVSPSESAARDELNTNDFVTNYPVLVVSRNQNSGRGKSCQYVLNNDSPLTPFIHPQAGDEVFLKFNVHYTTNRTVDFGATMSLVSSIGALATPSAGFTRNVTAISDAGLDTAINNFLGSWNRDVEATNIRRLKLNADDADPVDKIVISLNPPNGDESFGTLAFDGGPALSFELDYFPTLFASCRGYLSLAKCENDFDTDQQIIDKTYASQPQRSLRQISDEALSLGARSLAGRLIDTRSLGETEARDSIATICQDLKAKETFEPSDSLNLIDQLIFRYVWLTQLSSEFKTNRRLHSESCFTPEEESDLNSLSANRPRERFPFPEFELDVTGNVKRSVNTIGTWLYEGASGKERLFGEDGLLQINMRALVESADGQELRPGVARGADAAAALAPIKFVGGPACRQIATDLASRQETDRRFGFLNIVRDTTPGGLADPTALGENERGEVFAPFVIELTDDATSDNPQVKSVMIPASITQYLDALESSITPAQYWDQSCFAGLTSAEQTRALNKMRDLMGASN